MTPTSLPTGNSTRVASAVRLSSTEGPVIKNLLVLQVKPGNGAHEEGHFCVLLNAPVCSTRFLFSDRLQRHYLSLNQMHVASGNYSDESVIRQIISATLHGFPWQMWSTTLNF